MLLHTVPRGECILLLFSILVMGNLKPGKVMRGPEQLVMEAYFQFKSLAPGSQLH